jgi:uncharacterized membrane protein
MTNETSWATVVLNIVIILGLVVREIIANRHRQEARHERSRQAAEVKAELQRAQLAANSTNKQLRQQLEENTSITKKAVSTAESAYKAANSLNEKILDTQTKLADIYKQFADLLPARAVPRVQEQLEHIKETTDTTLEVVVSKQHDAS